jgi:hypothetical protein
MLSIKITPFLLFILLLAILVISSMMGKYFLSKEGFVSFHYSSPDNSLPVINIPTYSGSLIGGTPTTVKLYDNIYFDNNNGNIIEVDSTTYGGNVDADGSTISNTIIVPRDINTNPLTIQGNKSITSSLSQMIGVNPSNYSYKYVSQSVNTNKYIVFCFPFNTDTYIHMIDTISNRQLGSYYFNTSGYMKSVVNTTNTPIGLTTYTPFTLPPIENTVTESYYDSSKQLYQIGKYVKYDNTNGKLIIQTTPISSSDKSINIYDRNGNGVNPMVSVSVASSATSSTLTSTDFTPFTAIDYVGQNLVLYLPYKTNTVIAIIGIDPLNSKSYVLNNVVRFTSSGIVKAKQNHFSHGDDDRMLHGDDLPKDKSALSEYYKWYWYWNSNGGSSKNLNYSDDYLLKTQIVPPVCPSCPMCTGGACGNCGGSGGSGTLSQNGASVVGGNGQRSNSGNYSNIGNGTFSSNADANTIGGSLTLATYDTVAGVEGVAKTGGGVLSNAVNKTADVAGAGLVGAGLLGSSAINTVGKAVGGAVGTVGDVVKDVAHDATGLVAGAGSGIKDILTQNNNDNKKNGVDNTTTIGPDGKPMTINRTEGAFKSPYGTTTGTQSGDQYSYYGALPSKGDSNFMPVTADFSKFGR